MIYMFMDLIILAFQWHQLYEAVLIVYQKFYSICQKHAVDLRVLCTVSTIASIIATNTIILKQNI